jgi:copper chaperone CopZ
MDKAVFDVPKMYADHHVQPVRDALLQLDGVEQVTASSAFKRVVVTFDAKKADREALKDALRAAGYAPGEEWELPEVPEGKEDDSPWFRTIQRVTTTNTLDLELSGDHRRY